MIGIGSAAAGAIEPCPAVITLGTGIGVAGTEILAHFIIGDAVPDIAQRILLSDYKLVAGIQVSPGSNGHILST